MVFTGAFAYIQWAKESTFGTAATVACGNAFGFEQKITGWSFTNNKIPLSQLNDVRVKTYAYGQTRGSLSLDFVLSSPWFLGIIGFKDATSSCAPAPYTHTFEIDDTSATKNIKSFTTQIGQEAGGTDIVRTLTGGIVNSASISTSVGELAKVTLDTNYKNEALTTALDGTPASLTVCEAIPFTFAHGTLEWTDGACENNVIAEVQDVNITFTQNSDHIWGIGNSTANSAIRRLFEITGSFKSSHVNTDELVKVYAQQKDTKGNTCPAQTQSVTAIDGTAAVQLKLTFDNGEAGTDSRKFEFTFTGIALDDINVSIEPNEPIFEDINWQAIGCTVVATNNTATEPAATP